MLRFIKYLFCVLVENNYKNNSNGASEPAKYEEKLYLRDLWKLKVR